jgi:membrane fusion protein (multidrug efflux system)
VQKNEARIAQKNITAPFAGRLGLRLVEKGQYVKAGDPLVWLQSLDPIWIDFPVLKAISQDKKF